MPIAKAKRETLIARMEVKRVPDFTGVQIGEKDDLDLVIERLVKFKETMERSVKIHRTIRGTFWTDALYQLVTELRDRYGFVPSEPGKGFDGQPLPLQTQVIDVAYGETVRLPTSPFRIPGKQMVIQPMPGWDNGRPVLNLVGVAKAIHESEIDLIVEGVEKRIREHSIYRGKALELVFDEDDDLLPPKFLNLNGITEDDLVLPEDLNMVVRSRLFRLVKEHRKYREHGDPRMLRRSALLAGKIGCGKSLTARVLSKVCQDHGVTYLLLNKPTLDRLRSALVLMREWPLACLFTEDVDTLFEERNANMNVVLNEIDGVVGKGQEGIFVATTNFLDRFDTASIRPGRIDAVIEFRAPDAKAARAIAERVAGKHLREPISDETAERLSGMIPAVITEVVLRAREAAISEDGLVTNELLLAEATAMQHHNALCERQVKRPLGREQVIAQGLVDAAKVLATNGTHAADASDYDVQSPVPTPQAS